MDEGEEDHADAFDFDDDVLVFLYAHHIAFVAGKLAAGDAHPLVFLEVGFGENLTFGGVAGCEQAQQLDGAAGYFLYPVFLGVAVDPEWHRHFGVLAAVGFHFEGFRAGGADEEHARYYGAGADVAVLVLDLLGEEEYVVAHAGQFVRRTKFLARLDRVPMWGIMSNDSLAHDSIHFTLVRLCRRGRRGRIIHNCPSAVASDREGEPIQVLSR